MTTPITTPLPELPDFVSPLRKVRVMTMPTTTPLDELPEFLSPKEFGGYFRLSRSSVYTLVNSGAVRAVKFGRSIRIPKAEISRRLTDDHAPIDGRVVRR